jgi:transketolase
MAAIFNRPGFNLFDQYVYAIVTDGDLMEGITSEAASLAGHLALGRLVYLYDDNHISIDGSTDITFTEDRMARFSAYNWHVQTVPDGNDIHAIDAAIKMAKQDPRPSIIAVRTHIGYGLPTKQDTPKAHGEPPGEEELAGAKRNLDWTLKPDFFVPDEVLNHFRFSIERGTGLREDWLTLLNDYRQQYPDLGSELDRRWRGEFPDDWDADLPVFPVDKKGMATRNASGKVLNAVARKIPELIGGSADLTPSTKTWLEGSPSFQAGSYHGRNFNFGVREHAMGAVVNGMSLFGGIIPFGATFLVFSDYMRAAIRLSALSHYPSIWVYTHDSIGVGEDGPTHQPVEHLAALRSIPNLNVIRPGDANEVREAWKVALQSRDRPTALIFSRQAVQTLDRNFYAAAKGLQKGAYILADLGEGEPEIILMASGTEVNLICDAGQKLSTSGINVRIVSFPSWGLFAQQGKEYRNAVLPPRIHRRLAVEAGVSQGWHYWVGDRGAIISVEKFGASAPYKVVMEKYGFTVQNVLNQARELL